MDAHLKKETAALINSWMQHEERFLRDYLVADVEDPRINVQSILTRHFLTEALFGQRFAALKEQEVNFSAVMNWLVGLKKNSVGPEELQAIDHALTNRADDAEGLAIPHFISRTFAGLPALADGWTIPNYLSAALKGGRSEWEQCSFWEEREATFQKLWRQALETQRSPRISVLEPACGSANDYRFLDAFGLARLLDYTGFDLCEKNIRNAKTMFPNARFQVGNVFEIDAPDEAFDYSFVHDLFEHLSLAGLDVAIAELCRVTRTGIRAGFFNMHEGKDHIVRPVDDYHLNGLSLARTKELFERAGFAVQTVHIATFLKWRLACDQTHNKSAYTFLARRAGT